MVKKKIDYKELYEKELREGKVAKVMAVIFMFMFLATGVLMSMGGKDDVDIDDSLGPYLCEQHSLEFDRVEFENRNSPRSEVKELKIYCNSKEAGIPISDGYLVLNR